MRFSALHLAELCMSPRTLLHYPVDKSWTELESDANTALLMGITLLSTECKSSHK